MGRLLSGEAPVVATSIQLRKDTYSMVSGRQTTLEDIYSIFLMIEQLRTTGDLQEDSDGMCSERLIGKFVRDLHDLCRLKSVMVPISELDGIGPFLTTRLGQAGLHGANSHDVLPSNDAHGATRRRASIRTLLYAGWAAL